MDDNLLEELIPIPSLDEQREKIIEDLESRGFVITNYAVGSVFWTIILIFCQVRIDILKLLRRVYKGLFVLSATGTWLDVKAGDYSKTRKQATKATGFLTAYKLDPEQELVIPKGYIFKTSTSLAGSEYRFVAVERTVIAEGEAGGRVSIQAEKTGSSYNVPVYSIRKAVVHIEGLADVANTEGWLLEVGADDETDEQFKNRTLNSWAELSTMPIAQKYKNVAESVEGVLYAVVDDWHPRGQGTIDISVASYAGHANSELIAKVAEACEEIRGPYDDLLIKSAETVEVDVELLLYIPYDLSVDGIEEQASGYIVEYFKLNQSRTMLNCLYESELIYQVRKNIEVSGIRVVRPVGDIVLDKNKLIVLGSITVGVERV